MARVKLNPVIEEVRGELGDAVFRRTSGGGLSLIKKPDMSGVEWSPAQSAHRRRFQQAIAYARRAMSDPGSSAVYRRVAARQGRQPFRVAVSDYFHGKELLSK